MPFGARQQARARSIREAKLFSENPGKKAKFVSIVARRPSLPKKTKPFESVNGCRCLCHKFVGQFAECFGDKLLAEGVDIDFQAKLLFQVQNELNKVETLVNHLARLQGLDVVARNIRKVLCEKFVYSL